VIADVRRAPGRVPPHVQSEGLAHRLPEDTLLDSLSGAGVPVVASARSAISSAPGVSRSLHSEGNADGLRLTLDALRDLSHGLLFVNLVDFDMLYGPPQRLSGLRGALEELDAWSAAAGGAESRRRRVRHRGSWQRPHDPRHGSHPRARSAARVWPAGAAGGAGRAPVLLRSGTDRGRGPGIAPLPRGESFFGRIDGLIQ